MPIDALELDVHSTRDGKIVVMHDAGSIEQQTAREVYSMKIGRIETGGCRLYVRSEKNDFSVSGKGIGIPLLEDVFRAFPQMRFIVEIKQILPAIEEPIYRLIKKYQDGRQSYRCIREYWNRSLRFRSLAPIDSDQFFRAENRLHFIILSASSDNFYKGPGDALQIPPTFSRRSSCDPRSAGSAKKKGIVIHVWTVNDRDEMKQLIDYGVDGIITDFPDRLVEEAG